MIDPDPNSLDNRAMAHSAIGFAAHCAIDTPSLVCPAGKVGAEMSPCAVLKSLLMSPGVT